MSKLFHNNLGRTKIVFCALAISAPGFAQTRDTPREVNITQGSEPGWIPSEQLEADALEAWADYYRLLSQENYEAAYAMLSRGLRDTWPYEKYVNDSREARTERGDAEVREPLKVTWTKGAMSAPTKGVYAAIDTNARYQNVARFCGFTVLYKAENNDRFEIARIEENLLSNVASAEIESENSPLVPELIWHLLSRSCPNYIPSELPSSVNEGTGYLSVAEARADVQLIEGIELTLENDWTVLADQSSLTIWSFAPEGSPYYPALIKRTVVPLAEAKSSLKMTMLCESSKRLCDALYVEMAARNGLLPVSFE
ncbi:MAG: DUF4019 domain-containing protein [Erythrobacter sp.]